MKPSHVIKIASFLAVSVAISACSKSSDSNDNNNNRNNPYYNGYNRPGYNNAYGPNGQMMNPNQQQMMANEQAQWQVAQAQAQTVAAMERARLAEQKNRRKNAAATEDTSSTVSSNRGDIITTVSNGTSNVGSNVGSTISRGTTISAPVSAGSQQVFSAPIASRPGAVAAAATTQAPTKSGTLYDELGQTIGGTTSAKPSATAPVNTPTASAPAAQPPAQGQDQSATVGVLVSSGPLPIRAITPTVVNASTSSVQTAISLIYKKLKISNSDMLAGPISDNVYETVLTHETVLALKGGPKVQSAYVSVSLFENVISAGACDLQSSGACLILEKDSRTGALKKRAFFVYRDDKGISRRTEVANSVKSQVDTILENRPEGSYVVTGLEFR